MEGDIENINTGDNPKTIDSFLFVHWKQGDELLHFLYMNDDNHAKALRAWARKMKADAERIALDLQKAKSTEEIEKERIASQERLDGAQVGVDAASENAKVSSNEQITGATMGRDIADTYLHKEN